jgi:hypothetical protein
MHIYGFSTYHMTTVNRPGFTETSNDFPKPPWRMKLILTRIRWWHDNINADFSGGTESWKNYKCAVSMHCKLWIWRPRAARETQEHFSDMSDSRGCRTNRSEWRNSSEIVTYLQYTPYNMRRPVVWTSTRIVHMKKLKLNFWSLNILWHTCSRQELWSQQRQPLLGNGSANTPFARQQIPNTQQWSNSEAVFSTRSVR